MNKFKILAITLASSALLAVPVSVSAQTSPSGEQETSGENTSVESEKTKIRQRTDKKRAEFEAKRQDAKDNANEKRDEAKKKSCEKRTESFKKRIDGIVTRSERRAEVFNKIAERVQAFATDKNITVVNYEGLVEDVAIKAAAVKAAHELVNENADLFECDGDNAKTNVAIFKQAIQDEHAAFKDYKESIKNLIKAVKQGAKANSEEKSDEN